MSALAMPYEVVAGGLVHTVVDDRTVVASAVVLGRLVDETTGAPITVAARVRVDRAGLQGRVVDGGWLAISAVPAADLSRLDVDAYALTVHVEASGFEELVRTFALPAGTVLPIEVGEVALRRRATRVAGRVTHAATGAPIPDALVFADAPAGATPTLALRRPLALDHDAGVAVRRRRLDDIGVATSLETPARGGAVVLVVADRTGLAAGQVLRVGSGPDAELAVVDEVATEPADLTQPGDVRLTTPLLRGFDRGAPVRALDPAVVPQTRSLSVDARAGDGLLLLDGALGADTVHTVEIDDPGRREYHDLGAVTDAEGYWRLDGIGRVARLRLVVRAAGFTDTVRTVAPDYGATVTTVNVRLEP